MHPILTALRDIRMANTAIAIPPFVLTKLLYPFEYDYYMYWGNVPSSHGAPTLLWFICRDVTSISFEQVKPLFFLYIILIKGLVSVALFISATNGRKP